jgi:ABC-2 type transport system ATP-binding protein
MSESGTIELEGVTKFYGRHPGLVDLTAHVPRGTFVGLLGPNGSGKSTALRILSCCIPPTSGKARVCGFDVFTQSLEARRRLGYLPENCPLYPEMAVLEYLRWTAAMKGLSGSDIDQSIFAVMESCGVDPVRKRVIKTLSKGFRQRVGLASVLIHRPEVLILDEPTVGLDPLQVREFRSLLASFKGKHTVLISSHILSEIELLCDSVIILHSGQVIASGPPEALRGDTANRYAVECRSHPSLALVLPKLVDRIPGAKLEDYSENGTFARFRLQCRGEDPRLEISKMLTEAGIEVRELAREALTLEDVFVECIKARRSAANGHDEHSTPA